MSEKAGEKPEEKTVPKSSEPASPEDNPVPTSALLMAASKHIAQRCGAVNKAYIECKRKDKNPRTCLDEGRDVTECAIKTLRFLAANGKDELNKYVECMDYYSNRFEKCRTEQKAFEEKVPFSTL